MTSVSPRRQAPAGSSEIAASRGIGRAMAVALAEAADAPVTRAEREMEQMGAVTIWRAVRRVSERAGIAGNVGPHTLRHAFCDLVTRGSSIHVAQALMGHSDIGTTEGYAGAPTMDELRAATLGVRYPPSGTPENPVMETVGIEPTIPTPFDSVTGETETDGM